MAGAATAAQIAEELGRSEHAVKHMARRLGVSLKRPHATLEWCAECGAWRTSVSPMDGRCAVCRQRDATREVEQLVADALRGLSPKDRARFDEAARWGKSKLPPKPLKGASNPMSRRDRAHAEERFLRDVEAWEERCLRMKEEAAQSRLRRVMRKLRRG